MLICLFLGVNSRTARVLLLLVIPGHLIFMYTIAYVQAGHTSITPMFALVYLSAAFLQVRTTTKKTVVQTCILLVFYTCLLHILTVDIIQMLFYIFMYNIVVYMILFMDIYL